MAWRYEQATGRMFDPRGELLATGYSGHGAGINNPAMEAVANRGPIPRGRWLIGPAYAHATLGPVTMRLLPHGHAAQGRALFRIHGDNARGDRSASEGCIILPRWARAAIDASADDELEVA